MNTVNQLFAHNILLQDPETGEELFPTACPEDENGSLVLYVENKGGKRKWKHTILTEECGDNLRQGYKNPLSTTAITPI